MRVNIPDLNDFLVKEIQELAKNNFKVIKANYGVSLKRKGKWATNRASFVLNAPYFEVEALGFCAFIGYPIVDTIADTILVKHDILGSGVFLDDSNTFSPPFEPKHDFEMGKKIIINKPNDLLPIIEKFKLFFVKDALPYFEKWKDLHTVSEFLNDIPQMEVGDYLSFGVYKKAVVWKLCNNPRYDEYMNWIYSAMQDRYNKNPDGDIHFKRSANAIAELKEILDKTAPIY